MRRHIGRWGLTLGLTLCWAVRQANAQGPTIDTGLPTAPGSAASSMGTSPGAGGGELGNNPGGGGQMLGGRPGASTPRVPTAISNPGGGPSPTALQMGVSAPKPRQTPEVPFYGSLSLPQTIEDEGPPDGMTLDQAIETAVRENLDLRSKFFEIPQAEADIRQANLRSNPFFYADGQLIPYGQFNRASPGGPTQYDVNISYPLDISRKRQARTQVATRAKRVLEAQYEDAVRMRIDDVYSAYIDVLSKRQTIRYARKSVEGLNSLLEVEKKRLKFEAGTRAEVKRVEIDRDQAEIGLIDAEEQYRKTKRTLAGYLNIPPGNAEALEVHGSIVDRAPPPPPLDDLYRIALNVRPDIISFRLGIQRAEADVKLALANRMPDVYVLYQPYTYQNNQPYGLKSPTSWALGVTVPLPIYNRNQGGIQRARLNVTQTQIQLASLERQLMTDVAQAYHEYQNSMTMVRRMQEEVLPDADNVLKTSYTLYQGGEKDVTYYLNAQRAYNDVVKLYLDTMGRHRQSMLGLNTVIGQRILP